MKTIEIKGWVYLDEEKNFTTMNFHQRIPDNFNEMKNVARATMIIDIPEKKTSITESEFEKIMSNTGYDTKGYYYEAIVAKLFGAS